MSNATHIFLLDNVDSFTYNLVDELRIMGHQLTIYRNTVDAEHIVTQMQLAAKKQPVLLLLSPGPGAPQEAGCMLALLDKIDGQFPVLGICLGHQAIVEHLGGKVVRAEKVMHGKSSMIEHNGHDIFTRLPNPLPVARYHSLMVTDLPASLTLLAQTEQVPMAVLNDAHKMLGFQFHPESILTSQGTELLTQSIAYLTTPHKKDVSNDG